jgi:hypothetical protein
VNRGIAKPGSRDLTPASRYLAICLGTQILVQMAVRDLQSEFYVRDSVQLFDRIPLDGVDRWDRFDHEPIGRDPMHRLANKSQSSVLCALTGNAIIAAFSSGSFNEIGDNLRIKFRFYRRSHHLSISSVQPSD